MKKIFILVLLVLLTSSMVFANPQIGEKIGDVLYTDIITESMARKLSLLILMVRQLSM